MPSAVAAAPSPETRERILDAAERLFAAAGYEGTSMREIAAAAQVNGAAANYHFGTKEELYTQVFLRRIGPINAHRAALLDAAEAAARAAGREPTLHEVFASFARPIFAMAERAPAFLRLLARNVGAPPPFMSAVVEAQFRPLIDRYGRVLRTLLPQVPPETLFWRMHFVVGATLHCASHLFTVEQLSSGLCRTGDADTMLRELIDFAVAGMTAPVALTAPGETRGRRRARR